MSKHRTHSYERAVHLLWRILHEPRLKVTLEPCCAKYLRRVAKEVLKARVKIA